MSMDNGSIDLDILQRAWATFEKNETVYQEVQDDLLNRVTQSCRRQINAGDYDAAVPLNEVFDSLVSRHCDDESLFATSVLRSDSIIVDTMQYGKDTIARAIFKRLVEDLVHDGQLLYVYNRQQVRSHVAEMTRYFALMRQRLTDQTDYQFTPNLVKMVKLASADREQPIFGSDNDQAANFRTPIRQVIDLVSDESTNPAWELDDKMGSEWDAVIKQTMETMSRFFDEGLSDEFDSLAAYQSRAFTTLYLDAVTDQSGLESLSHVVTASTGGGKTEAFMFPALAYCLTASKAGIDSSKTVLTYPRTDLCDNQFERAFEYITELNQIEGSLEDDFAEAPLTISIQHGSRDDVTLPCPHCDGTLEVPDAWDETHFQCDYSPEHTIKYASVNRRKSADIVVTTQNSLHRRLMDRHGQEAFWECAYPPKFLILDEVHIYTDQAGMNVANVIRRFKQAIKRRAHNQSPTLVASSATINNAEDFTRRIFATDQAKEISPNEEEKDTTSREHFIFVKATDPRDIVVPLGDSAYRPREEWEDVSKTTASNLSCMIQIAFGFFHTMRKEHASNRDGVDANKDRVLGFVDSIDSVSRLGGYIQEAEQKGLFKYRLPDAILGERGNNPDCPRDLFRGATDDEYDEDAVCESVVPNKNINPCPVYQDGECWWTMRDRELDIEDMTVAIHRSGNTKLAGSDKPVGDDWDQLITTSALEVGFDHASIIGTFQYRAPRSVPGFLQRKGRGGRDAADEPMTVVVLGSTPTDSYYFHHSNYLSNPRDEHLKIPLDEENRFIRAEHMTAAIMDYFNISDTINTKRAFQGLDSSGPDIEYLRQCFDNNLVELRSWLSNAFGADDEEINEVISKFNAFLTSVSEPVAPDIDETPYHEFFSEMVDQGDSSALEYVDKILRQVETKE